MRRGWRSSIRSISIILPTSVPCVLAGEDPELVQELLLLEIKAVHVGGDLLHGHDRLVDGVLQGAQVAHVLAHDDPWALAHPELPAVTRARLIDAHGLDRKSVVTMQDAGLIPLLDAAVAYLPSPFSASRRSVSALELPAATEVTLECSPDPSAPLRALAAVLPLSRWVAVCRARPMDRDGWHEQCGGSAESHCWFFSDRSPAALGEPAV